MTPEHAIEIVKHYQSYTDDLKVLDDLIEHTSFYLETHLKHETPKLVSDLTHEINYSTQNYVNPYPLPLNFNETECFFYDWFYLSVRLNYSFDEIINHIKTYGIDNLGILEYEF